jgi:hypothetical protein
MPDAGILLLAPSWINLVEFKMVDVVYKPVTLPYQPSGHGELTQFGKSERVGSEPSLVTLGNSEMAHI